MKNIAALAAAATLLGGTAYAQGKRLPIETLPGSVATLSGEASIDASGRLKLRIVVPELRPGNFAAAVTDCSIDFAYVDQNGQANAVHIVAGFTYTVDAPEAQLKDIVSLQGKCEPRKLP